MKLSEIIRQNRLLFGLRNLGLTIIGLAIVFPAMAIGLIVMPFDKILGGQIGEFPWLLLINPEEL